jgi:hypothetical protein
MKKNIVPLITILLILSGCFSEKEKGTKPIESNLNNQNTINTQNELATKEANNHLYVKQVKLSTTNLKEGDTVNVEAEVSEPVSILTLIYKNTKSDDLMEFSVVPEEEINPKPNTILKGSNGVYSRGTIGDWVLHSIRYSINEKDWPSLAVDYSKVEGHTVFSTSPVIHALTVDGGGKTLYPSQSFSLRVQTISDKPIQDVFIYFLYNSRYVLLNKVNENTWESTIQVAWVQDYIIRAISFDLEKGGTVTYYNKNLPGDHSNSFDFLPNNVKVIKYPKPTITTKITRDTKTIIGKAPPKSYVNISMSDPIPGSGYGIGAVQADALGNFKWNLLQPFNRGGYLTFTASNSMFNPADIDEGAVYAESDSVRFAIPPLAPTISTKITNKTTTIFGRAEPNIKVIAKVNKKIIASTTANQYSDFKMKIKPIGAGSTVEILTIDQNKTESKTVKKIVIDVIPPSSPAVKKVTTKSKSITGKAEKYSFVEIRVQNKLLGKVKATRAGTYSLKIKKLKKGTLIKIVAIDAAKNRSKQVTTKVY